MNSPLSIRPAIPSDAAALARVHGDTWCTAYRGIVPDAHLDRLASSYDRRVMRWREGLTSPIDLGEESVTERDLTRRSRAAELATRRGFEPRSEEPKSPVLPLHHRVVPIGQGRV